VKTGSGAFMPTLDRSRDLAQSLVNVANGAGTKTGALITDMNEPLASAAGNGLEIRNAVDFLTGAHRDPRLYDVTLELCAAALQLTGFEGDAKKACEVALWSGRATQHFAEMVALLGGPADFVERMDKYLTPASIVVDVVAPGPGTISEIDTRGVGMAVVALGGGRRMPTDTVDHSVGFDRLLGLGAKVEAGTPLARLHARDAATAADASRRLIAAYKLGDAAPSHPLIADRIDPPEAT
jgi:thymidine phosphorylase